MLARRIIPCLDVRDDKVVKGVRFRNHETVGGILELAGRYVEEGADELVFYDITASAENRSVSPGWVRDVAALLDIPFTVAGGIRTLADAALRLENGAEKISINSPALERPALIGEMAREFGSQCVVLGVDSLMRNGGYGVCQYTGSAERTLHTGRDTLAWIAEAIDRGAGEVVLNCMDQDGVRQGYDLEQLSRVREICPVPLIASGGAGAPEHFRDAFLRADADGALAASVFHRSEIAIPALKRYLAREGVEVRI
ncbi:MAG: imidazole glycerol phosphate synthase subunit HisF [Proteobacteria bacterium]|nr:imidazole glycerol phosphate synthase subunit HisF [Pseudomonadota bacterium]